VRVSVITAVFNRAENIEDCIKSIHSQSYKNVEHIVIDGGSVDGTLDIIRKYKNEIAKVISEPDNGIYDALNKGIRMASGDVIGLLHGDDFYAHNRVLESVANAFEKQDVDSCYGDLLYVYKNDTNKVIRYWRASEYHRGKFRFGWMPPHPTFFVRRKIYEKYGYFNTDFRIAADYELMLRFLGKYSVSTHYIPEVLVKMRLGGSSNRSLKNLWIKSFEDYKAWKVNDLRGSLHIIFLKHLIKVPQFIKRV
jgi:glycosyltransferase